MQHELFARAPFTIVPEQGRAEPRLWVRRLVIYEQPGEVIRDVHLRPGLNVIWSPDPGTRSPGEIGHGGGKTMFCRLLRYCLGEDSFAPDGQRRRIWGKLPNAVVAAEVMIDGTPWTVIRSLGRRSDAVYRGVGVDGIQPDSAGLDIGAFRSALTGAFLREPADMLARVVGKSHEWETALAWATRDQECRFHHALDWRDPETGSRSPVRGRSKEDMLLVVRACIGALSADELLAREREQSESKALASIARERSGLDWQIERAAKRLGNSLGGTPVPGSAALEVAALRAAATQMHAEALQLPSGAPSDLDRARASRDEAAVRLRTAEDALATTQVRIEEKRKALGFVEGELPVASAIYNSNKVAVCPICRVPVDEALAKGCKITLEDCDLEGLRIRVESLSREKDSLRADLAGLQANEAPLKHEQATASQILQQAERAVSALESTLLNRARGIRLAERAQDEVERYAELVGEREACEKSLAEAEARLDALRTAVTSYREASAEKILDLSGKFDGIVRELVPGNVAGRIVLDGNGLMLRVELGGERSTAAIDSWKIVAFDLAVLAAAIEGRAPMPAFLVHDSPREADLGFSLYARLFDLVRKLEAFCPDRPLFQYIITTTTEPPEAFRAEPWLRLTLRGAPPEDRLLKMDL